MNSAASHPRPALEVADIIRCHGEAFLQKCGGTLTAAQKKTLRELAECRTAALGGHVLRCLDCGHEQIAYNSCRNRHCPKCQASARAAWLEREAEHLLPVEYHHVVFTLPQQVAEVADANRVMLYDLLFEAASATLREVAANPKRLGAQIGVLAVLHTWGQNLHHHPHLHCVVTGGGLSCDAKGQLEPQPRWVSCPAGFFLPVRILSQVFRGKYVAGLRKLLAANKLSLPGRLAALTDKKEAGRWLTRVQAKEWVVYAKPPFGGPEQVLKYLARYTHRVAISNGRLIALEDGRVSFRYKDYAAGRQEKTMTLHAGEFLRRFCQHILPLGFVKIRHYGLLGNRYRQERLAVCRRLLLVVQVLRAAEQPTADEASGGERGGCPECGGRRWARGEEVAAGPGCAGPTAQAGAANSS
jgi:Putative transposase/Transposase zinc-binding domain